MIIGVGGFLGVGEKNVAVAFPSLKLAEKDGKRYLVLNTTKEALKSPPAIPTTAARARGCRRPSRASSAHRNLRERAGAIRPVRSGKTSPMGSSKTNPALPQ